MERRSAVEIWSELGFLGESGTPKVKCGTNVYISTGSDEVYIFSVNEKNLKIILQFFAPVSDLVESCDKLLFVACRTGVYCINLQLLLQRYEGSSSPVEVKISSEFLAVEADGVSSLLLVGPVLLTLSQSNESWLLTLYNKPTETRLTSCEVLSSFCMPQISPVVQEDVKLKARQTRKSVLICVHCGDEPSSSGETDTSFPHVHLEPVLFKLLFGVEAALIRSPVILFGLPDGRLCFLPLRLPGSRLRVLHSLEQPVVFVGASVVMETDPGHAQGLVVVGEQGRVVLIKTDRVRTERSFTEGCVPGPVVCGCVDKNYLYYSTGSDLLTLNLSEGSAGTEDRGRDEEVLQSPTSLNVCRVIALNETTCNTAGEVKLFGLSVSGQLQCIKPPGQRTQDEGLSELPSPQVGRNVRDLLAAIGDVFERASLLKTIIKSKNQTLRELNQVVNISFLLSSTEKTGESFPIEGKPIKCRATARWSSLLQKDSLNLMFVLDNSSPYVLDRGWTLSISISPLCSSSNTRAETSKNFSVPFRCLCPGESFEVTLPVAAAGDMLFPLTVTCSLIFSLSGFLREEEVLSSPGLQSSCFTLPLNTLTVDWLHTLQIISPTAACKMTTFRSNATDAIQALLSSRRMRFGGEDGALMPEKYSARVCLSSQLLRDTLMPKSCNVDTKFSCQTLCSSLLDWLLLEDHGGVKMGHKSDKNHTNTLVIHAHALNEATIKLTAKEVNVEDANSGMEEEEDWVNIEVRIDSSSMTAVCGLHHAVLCRIQSLLKKAPEEAASTRKVLSLGLRRALQRAEILQTQISEALSVGASSRHANRFLLGFYQDLRENSLLII